MIKPRKNWKNLEAGLYFFQRHDGSTFIGKHYKGFKYPYNVMNGKDEIDVEYCLMVVPTYEELKDDVCHNM